MIYYAESLKKSQGNVNMKILRLDRFFHHQKDEECFFGVEVIDLIPHSSRITLILPIIHVSMYQLNLSKRGFV